MGRKIDPACGFAWLVLPWICLATAVGSVMWLSSLVGGAATLFSIVGCSILFWLFFKQSLAEKGAMAKAVGLSAAALFGCCAVVIVAGVFHG